MFVFHAYSEPGYYPLTLTVTDENGLTDKHEWTLHVLEQPIGYIVYSGSGADFHAAIYDQNGVKISEPVDSATGAHALERTLLPFPGKKN